MSTTALLVACGKADKEADAPTTFSYVYAVDPASLDYSIATRTSTTDVIGNVVDGLMENDQYGNVAPSQKDYDLNSTGWAPSYQDSASYLNIMDPKSGSAMKHLGITKGKDKDVVANKYKKLLEDAVSETTDLENRYEKYAKAQAWSTDSSLLMPTASSGGSPVVSNVVPFSKPYSQVVVLRGPIYL